jgi:acyl-homoserine-lactone acylase
VPGKLDVMGASIASFPIISIGFNKDVAWTHTVSTARRFTLFELKLADGDPTTYLIDGKPRKMTTKTVSYAATLADGRTEQRSHTFYMTEYGPVVAMPQAGLPWTAQKAYTLRDANQNNTRSIDTWLDIARAHNVGEIRTAIGNLGIPWVNTIATDRSGRAMFADVSVTPNVSTSMLESCAPAGDGAVLAKKLMAATGMVLLDGSRGACNWTVDPASPVPGLVPPSAMPVLEREDFVANSNDSSWLANPAQKMEGFSGARAAGGAAAFAHACWLDGDRQAPERCGRPAGQPLRHPEPADGAVPRSQSGCRACAGRPVAGLPHQGCSGRQRSA